MEVLHLICLIVVALANDERNSFDFEKSLNASDGTTLLPISKYILKKYLLLRKDNADFAPNFHSSYSYIFQKLVNL